MKLINFPEANIVIAKNQPQYHPMPAHIDRSERDTRTTICWQLSWRERLVVLFTGQIWHQILTFNKPMQPQKLMAEKPIL